MTLSHAMWSPGWYELDQSLKIGERHEFCFFRTVPGELATKAGKRLVFYNTLVEFDNALRAEATVVSIENSELGMIREIDTTGLDYTIRLESGDVLTINAEEEPGLIYEKVDDIWERSERQVEDWNLLVGLEDLEEPLRLDRNWKPRRRK